jgi:hypothetical protein
MQALVGERLDPDAADRLEQRLEMELPGYDVYRHIRRGDEQGQIRVIFRVEKTPWIPFTQRNSQIVYHSKQGWSTLFDVPVTTKNNNQFVFGAAFGNQDDLIERYSAFWLRYEYRMAGTERLGVRIESSRLRQTWEPTTLFALGSEPAVPDAYRRRQTIEPVVTFAFSPEFRISVGASFTDLESHSSSPDAESIGAGVASLHYDESWDGDEDTNHELEASYEVRTATRALESDLVYNRHLGEARYEYERGSSTVETTVLVGRITGRAPLFERFSLGNSSMLRRWNKFDIAPLGGDSVVHHSLEYRFHALAVFYDVGPVWDQGTDPKIRVSSGFGFHDDGFSLTIAFPLRSSAVRPMLIAKVVF